MVGRGAADARGAQIPDHTIWGRARKLHTQQLKHEARRMPFQNYLHQFKIIRCVLVLVAVAGCAAPSQVPPQDAKATEILKGVLAPHGYGNMAFSPDGQTLALPKGERGIELRNVITGAATVLPNPRGEEHCTGTLAYSKRGEFLAASYGRGITIWRVAESKELVRIPKERGALNMVFTDGDRTLVAQELIPVDDQTEPFYFHSRIVRWDVSSGTRLGSVDFGAHHSFRAISPDGRYGVIWVGPADDYDVCDLTTRAKIFVLTGSGNAIFSEDGSKLVWCRKSRIALFEVPSGKELRHFEIASPFAPPGSSEPLSLSSDGKLLAVGGFPEERFVGLISLESGRVLESLQCGPPLTVCKEVRLSPDGRTLATITYSVDTADQPVASVMKVWRLPETL